MSKLKEVVLGICLIPFFSFGQGVDCEDLGGYWSEVIITPAVCRNQIPFDNGHGLISITASSPSDGINFSYLWTEDGTGSTISSPTWGNRNPGFYTMVVTGDNGCVMDTTIYLDSLSPVSNFEATSPQFTSNYTGPAPLEVIFTNNSSNYALANLPAYGNNSSASTYMYWEFNNVYENASLLPLTKIYDTDGLYSVCLFVIENLNGCVDSSCIEINVGTNGLPGNCENEDCENDFILYPNPTHNYLNVSYYINDESSESLLKIFDLSGKLIFTQNLTQQNGSIDLAVLNFEKGIYLVSITSYNGGSVSKRLVID